MRKQLVAIAATAAIVWISGGATAAAPQAQPERPIIPPADQAPQPASRPAQNTPLEIQVVISRYQGEKRISSLPYVLSLKSSGNASQRQGASLRLGTRVPIRIQVVTPAAEGKPSGTSNSVNYEQVGTNIDLGATALEDGRFELSLAINESSVATDPQELRTAAGMDNYPVFRSYQSTNTLFVKDGQTAQFTAATDRIGGEVVRVEVKLTVMK